MLLGLFNDVYEDYRLDQPWLFAKILSQMFPEEFEPASSHERIILMKQVKHMFPEQLGGLTSWNELSIPSVLIHLAPQKFAQLDFKHLDQYVDQNANYGDLENIRHLFLRIVGFAQTTVPVIVNRVLTPQVEQEIKFFLRQKTESASLSGAANNLDFEWLFDRIVLKFRQSNSYEPITPEPVAVQHNHPEWIYSKPSEASPIPVGIKCPWGPILCSMNRVSFQRKHVIEKEEEKNPVSQLRRPKIVPNWLRSIKRKSSSNSSSEEISKDKPHQRLPAYFRRLRLNPGLPILSNK